MVFERLAVTIKRVLHNNPIHATVVHNASAFHVPIKHVADARGTLRAQVFVVDPPVANEEFQHARRELKQHSVEPSDRRKRHRPDRLTHFFQPRQELPREPRMREAQAARMTVH